MKISQPATILAYLPLYIAIKGTGHEIVTYDSPKNAIEATVKGETDISIGDPFMFDYMDYEKVVIFAGFAKGVFHSLVTFDPFIKEASKKDLQGKTIVAYPEPSTSFFLCKRLKEGYLLDSIIQTPFNTELGPLLTQEADLAIVLEPNTTYALKNGAKELIDFSKEKAVMTGFCTTKKYLAKNKKELREFLALMKKGFGIFQADEKLTLETAKKYFPLVNEKILAEAINKIRNAGIYCLDFKFSEKEIVEGMKMRQIILPLQKVKKFIVTPFI